MKKTIFTAASLAWVLIFVALLGSCASGGVSTAKPSESAAQRLENEGYYYYMNYKFWIDAYKYDEGLDSPLTDDRIWGGRPPSPPTGVQREEPSEQSFDRAVTCMQAAHELDPTMLFHTDVRRVDFNNWLVEAYNSKEKFEKWQREWQGPLQDDDFEVRQNPDNTITITGFNIKERKDLVIPETIYNLPVTAIADSVFRYKKLRSVVIPDTVTTMGRGVFQSNSLTRVVIGKGIRVIPSGAFTDNPSLAEITIPDWVTEIEGSGSWSGTFENCGLTSVNLPAGLEKIGQNAFKNNDLTSVTLPAGLQTIGYGAFQDNNLTSVTLPAGLQTIGGAAFSGNQIHSVTIPRNDITVDSTVFDRDAITRITLPANVSRSDLRLFGFENTFLDFYEGQGRDAGTYEKNGPVWARSRAGGID